MKVYKNIKVAVSDDEVCKLVAEHILNAIHEDHPTYTYIEIGDIMDNLDVEPDTGKWVFTWIETD